MDEFTRSKVQLQRVTDDKLRQDMFSKRKQALVKKAMELSVLCDCDVGLIIFGPGATGPGAGGQRLTQYSSTSMDELLERYAAAVAEPHERRRNGELLRHYYELSPDEDEEEAGRNGDGTASTSAAAAAAAATMAAVDSIILGGGGRRMDGAPNFVKRMRLHSPGPGLGPGGGPSDILPGMGVPARTMPGIPPLPGPGTGPPAGLLGNGNAPHGQPGAPAPIRRVGAVGGAPLPLEGIKAAGFLDKRNYPLSPSSETAFEEITAEFDKLAELRNQRSGAGGRQTTPTVLQPISSSAAGPGFSLASHQQHLQQILLQQQQLLQQRQQQQGGGAKRFKPLSILVPEIQTHPIIPTNLTPLNATSGQGAGPSGAHQASEQPHGVANGADHHRQQQQQPHPASPFDGSLQHQHLVQQQQQQPQTGASLTQSGGLPPRPPLSRLGAGLRPHQGAAGNLQGGRGLPGSSTSPGPIAISPTAGAGGQGFGGPGEAAPMDVDGGAAAGGGGGGYGLDRRSGGMLGDDALGSLMGSSAFRTSLDGSAANLLTIPSPPPHGGAHALFGSLDGGPLSMRSSSHGMLGSLSSLDRGPSLGLGGLGMSLESPGAPMGLDTALRGLAPMDVLDWPSMSPRSSAGNGDGPGSSDGGGGFPDEGEGEGGTVMDGLIVRGTALSKLAPEALEAAIGSSPDSVGIGGTPGGSVRARMTLSAFSSGPSSAAAAQLEAAAAVASPVQRSSGQQQQQGRAAAHSSPGSPHLNRQDVGAGSSSTPAAGSKSRTPGEAGHAAGGGLVGMSGAGSMGLLPEMSLSDLVQRGGPGCIAAAAAAATAAVDAQQDEADGRGGEQETADVDIGLGLEVVGKALVIPNGARGNLAQGGESGRGAGGGSPA